MREFCEEMEMALVITRKEEKEGVDRFAVERAVFNWLFRKDNSDDVERFRKEKIARVGNANAIRQGRGHQALAIEQKIGDHFRIELQIFSDALHRIANDFFFRVAGNLVINSPLVDRAIESELL